MTAPSSGQSIIGDHRPSVVAPMSPEVLEALRGSINKWEAIVAGTGRDNGSRNCPLCQMFVKGRSFNGECVGCPVMVRTGKLGCHGSPYYDVILSQPKTVQAELDFLKSLLPESAS